MLLLWGWHWSLLVLALIVVAVLQLTRARAAQPVSPSPSGAAVHPMSSLDPTAAAGPGPAPRMTDQKYCSGCGILIHKSAYQCPACGAPQAVAQVGQKSRVAAILFALLLGGIGVHKFYLGRIGQGVLYVLFCWTGVPFLIALIEGIIYLTMTDQAFAAKYG